MKYVFKGFTEKANTALNMAIEVAQQLGHTYIGTEQNWKGKISKR